MAEFQSGEFVTFRLGGETRQGTIVKHYATARLFGLMEDMYQILDCQDGIKYMAIEHNITHGVKPSTEFHNGDYVSFKDTKGNYGGGRVIGRYIANGPYIVQAEDGECHCCKESNLCLASKFANVVVRIDASNIETSVKTVRDHIANLNKQAEELLVENKALREKVISLEDQVALLKTHLAASDQLLAGAQQTMKLMSAETNRWYDWWGERSAVIDELRKEKRTLLARIERLKPVVEAVSHCDLTPGVYRYISRDNMLAMARTALDQEPKG